jgi:hypothetical protein
VKRVVDCSVAADGAKTVGKVSLSKGKKFSEVGATFLGKKCLRPLAGNNYYVLQASEGLSPYQWYRGEIGAESDMDKCAASVSQIGLTILQLIAESRKTLGNLKGVKFDAEQSSFVDVTVADGIFVVGNA